MCSLNDGDIEEVLCMEKLVPLSACGPDILCRKCNDKTAKVILRVRDAYCRECFLISTVHKFRATLGKSKLMKPKDQVLVAYSGSQSSVALLHLLQDGVNKSTHKRLLFSPKVVFIDEGAVLGQTKEERQYTCASVAELIKNSGFPAYIITLDRSLQDHVDVQNAYSDFGAYNPIVVTDDEDKEIQKIINATTSLTSKEDLIYVLRRRLLLKVARQLSCSKIFMADVGTDLAIRILSNISLGRGAQLPMDVGWCDERDPDIKILRPMRDFVKKEITFYNIFHELHEIRIPSLGTLSDSDASIQKLTENFVTELQNEFPATVSTVFRTGNKLSLSSDMPLSEDSCALCLAPLDTVNLKSSALQATEFSRMISHLGPSGFDSTTLGSLGVARSAPAGAKPKGTPNASSSCCTNVDKECACSGKKEVNKEEAISWDEAEEFLCYGCRLITREIGKSIPELPSLLEKLVKERSVYKRMRREIEDFLL